MNTIESSCIDCGTDWSGTSVLTCPMCGSNNIVGTVIKSKPLDKTIKVPPGLEDWARKAMDYVRAKEER